MQLSAQMSSSIFLQPVGPSKRVVFIDGHNTSSAQNLGFQALVTQDLQRRGYRITQTPSHAEYMLMYNVLYVGKQQASYTAAGALAGGFGGALTSALNGGNAGADVGYGALGALVGGVVGHFIKHKQRGIQVVLSGKWREKPPKKTLRLKSKSVGQGLSEPGPKRDPTPAEIHIRHGRGITSLAHGSRKSETPTTAQCA